MRLSYDFTVIVIGYKCNLYPSGHYYNLCTAIIFFKQWAPGKWGSNSTRVIFKLILWIFSTYSEIGLRWVPESPVGNKSTLTQVMVGSRPGNKPIPERMFTQIYGVTRSPWVTPLHLNPGCVEMKFDHQVICFGGMTCYLCNSPNNDNRCPVLQYRNPIFFYFHISANLVENIRRLICSQPIFAWILLTGIWPCFTNVSCWCVVKCQNRPDSVSYGPIPIWS